MWAALAHNFKGVACSCYDISCEKYSSFNYTYGSFYWSFDKSFRRLIDDFPDTLSDISEQHIRIA